MEVKSLSGRARGRASVQEVGTRVEKGEESGQRQEEKDLVSEVANRIGLQ